MAPSPEQAARVQIDAALIKAGWLVQDARDMNLHAGRGVAVREAQLQKGHGAADYLLFVDAMAAGVIEAKKQGETLTGVEVQAERYSEGVPALIPAHIRPLPFLYQSTGVETRFTNRLDPAPRSRSLFHFHRPETLAEWLSAEPLQNILAGPVPLLPSTLRGRFRRMPEIEDPKLWPAQLSAVRNLETSLAEDRPRALIQMRPVAARRLPP
jgi:type I restriction enzyme R subunit